MRKQNQSVVFVSIMAVVLIGLMVSVFIVLAGKGHYSAGKTAIAVDPEEKRNWTLKELVGHIEKKRKVAWYTDSRGNPNLGISPSILVVIDPDDELEPAQLPHIWRHTRIDDNHILRIVHHPTIERARESAGASPKSRQWGRFEFIGSKEELDEVFAMLPP